ncbi:BamA/TamA family outer membrane protein [Halanaerobacter jeridensis]|uniref:Outer membrane protein assembly factor BamA n=1 Tax=Halanaerobacter jeridensis TaxID=706427 RepID=A0A939BR04_9FIRM|nr:BamA/TamA family outer membrane protein [Halanaerobacter jeridensis]MBM7556884.1 outer membrane protein assembly factor BamA [Halanaerobacter jeridensis]
MIKKSILILLIVILSSGLAVANDPETTLIPIPLIFSSPETGLAGGGMGMYFKDTELKNIQSRFGAFYTAEGQANLFLQAEQEVDEYKYSGQFSYQDWVNKFYGLNNEVVFNDGLEYDSQGFSVEGGISKRLAPNSFLGLVANYESYDLNLERKLKQNIRGIAGVDLWGLGLKYTYDTRDRMMDTRSGQYLEYQSIIHSEDFSESDFIAHELDYRFFKQLAPKHVLGWQSKLIITNGALPLQKMNSLGNMRILRGYESDKFLAANKVATQLEYRYPIYKKWSGTLFAGIGEVYQEFEVDDLEESWGLGLRYNLDKKRGVNLRMDFAFNSQQSNFYFNVGEAF